jgi:plastocyanin
MGKVPVARGGFPSIVILESQVAREFPPQAVTPVMDQVSLSFIPELLLVRTGQPAEFRNSDDVLHNVRVREEATKAPSFNVAIPTGQVFAHTFPRDGFYDVGCDIHPGMAAQIVATSTPYATTTDPEGNFVIRDVLPGSYTLTVYAGADRIDQPVEVGGGRTEVVVAPR